MLSAISCEKQNSLNEKFSTYQSRLANATKTTPLPLSPDEAIPLPSKRVLFLPLTDLRVNLLDAYELKDCGLFDLIAEKNSILGKIQGEFQQLQYDLDFIYISENCINQINDPSLRTALTEAYQIKKSELNRVVSNAISGSNAWRTQLTYNDHQPLPEQGVSPELIIAIEGFTQPLLPNNNLDDHQDTQLINTQENIEKKPALGRLFYSIDESTRWLNTISQQLNRDNHQILCGLHRNNTQFAIAYRVFQHFYIDELQPYLAMLNSEYLSLSPSLLAIHQFLPSNTAFTPYSKAYFQGEHYEQFKQAIKNHIVVWQSLIERCGRPVTIYNGNLPVTIYNGNLIRHSTIQPHADWIPITSESF